MADLEDVARIANALPATTQSGSSWAVEGKGFAWSYREKVAEKQPRVERPDVLAVRVANRDEKEVLLAAEPEKFFTTPHYNGFPAVLVRLPAVDGDELADLLTGAWRSCAPRKMRAEFDAKANG
jgi:hypothetical protein